MGEVRDGVPTIFLPTNQPYLGSVWNDILKLPEDWVRYERPYKSYLE